MTTAGRTKLVALAVTLTVGCEDAPSVSVAVAPASESRTALTEPTTSAEKPIAEKAGAATPADAEASAGRTLDRTFNDIKFDIEPDAPFERDMLTDEIESLAGRRIKIRGYILPAAQKHLKQFVLVRDNLECCFGPGAALYDCILVDMEPGATAEYTPKPVAVEGEFAIEPFGFGDRTLAVFRMKGEEVE